MYRLRYREATPTPGRPLRRVALGSDLSPPRPRPSPSLTRGGRESEGSTPMAHRPDPELVRAHEERQRRELERWQAEETARKAAEAAERARQAAEQRLRDLERGR